jgi:hypothetical protein
VRFKPPLVIDYDDNLDNILGQMMDAIEQSTPYKNKGI